MAVINLDISYLDTDGIKAVHTVSVDSPRDEYEQNVREVTEDITKDGFFLKMEETRHIFIPPSSILRMEFNLIDTEDGS